MKHIIIIAISAFIFASAVRAQMICQTLSNGQIICTPAGGGPSSYR